MIYAFMQNLPVHYEFYQQRTDVFRIDCIYPKLSSQNDDVTYCTCGYIQLYKIFGKTYQKQFLSFWNFWPVIFSKFCHFLYYKQNNIWYNLLLTDIYMKYIKSKYNKKRHSTSYINRMCILFIRYIWIIAWNIACTDYLQRYSNKK